MSTLEVKLGWATALGQTLLRVVWFGVIPALLAALWLQYCLPPATGADGTIARLLAAADRFPIPTFVILFLVFAGLLRYWRYYLPWGYCLARLAPAEAATVSRAELVELVGKTTTKPKRAWLELLLLGAWLALAAGAALLLRDTALQSYSVLSGSMLPSFAQGDELSTNRRAYAGASAGLPARGDVVIFRHDTMQEVVKRVIALPGDEVRMHGGFPIINGWEVPHCDVGRYVHLRDGVKIDGRVFVEFLAGSAYLTLHVPPARPFESYLVKPGEVFVLGDNRNSSLDSRNWKDSAPSGLPVSAIVGRVERIVLRRKRSGEIDHASLLSELGLHMNADGFDMAEARRKLDACIVSAPPDTRPPAAPKPAASSSIGAAP
jgi:signal peptidase I